MWLGGARGGVPDFLVPRCLVDAVEMVDQRNGDDGKANSPQDGVHDEGVPFPDCIVGLQGNTTVSTMNPAPTMTTPVTVAVVTLASGREETL